MTVKVAAVIEGGGRNGAFAMGAIYRVVSDGGVRFDVTSGTSTGALIAGPLLLDDIEVLNDLYRGGVRKADILESKFWPAGLIDGSFHRTAPLRRLVERYTDHDGLRRAAEEGRFACVTYTNFRTRRAVRHWSGDRAQVEPRLDLGLDEVDQRYGLEGWIDAVVASASMPIIMEGVEIGGDICFDGGIREITPFAPAAAIGAERVWVFHNSPPRLDEEEENPSGLVGVAGTMISMFVDEVSKGDVSLCAMQEVPEVRRIAPRRDLGSSLDFDPEEMGRIWREGFAVAGSSLLSLGDVT